MNMEYNTLFKNFQSTIVSYQDISAIYTKLFTQGQVQKLANVFHEIYDEEHVFTLTELQKYCKENDQREDEFVAEQYELNSNIFRRNLTLIVQSLVDEVGKNFLDRFKQEFSTRSNRSKEGQYEDNQASELSYEKSQYKSNMPEIQEETEQSAGIPPQNSSTFRAKTNENEQEQPVSSQNKFDLNINDLNKRVSTQPSQGQIINNNNQSNDYKSQIQQQQQQQQYQLQQQQYQQEQEHKQRAVAKNSEEQYRRAYTTEHEREEAYHNASSSLRNDDITNATSEGERYEGFNQYDNDHSNYKANLQKYYKQPVGQNNFNQFNNAQFVKNPNWSSPERTKALANKHMTPTASQKKSKAASPSPNRLDTSNNNSYMNRSASRWSSANDRPDPSVLDSEFSYGSGKSFAKSPKKFHYDINKVPGPGNYELEESKKLVRSVTPDVSFPKSPKVPSYFKKSNVPGAIYYPVKHYLSK